MKEQEKEMTEKKHTPGILIAAPMSGSGKTTFTVGLLSALKDMGRNVCSFKCGPDYIDPMYHTKTLGIPCRNLDTWFTDEKMTRSLFHADDTDEEQIHVVEGVMGLYDGVAGTEKEGSSYDLARVLGLPILLVVPARGMGRSVIALIKGFQAEDTEGLLRGVVLNQISEAFYQRLAPLIEAETGLSCLGFLPKDERLTVPGRYLGLTTPSPDGKKEGWDAVFVRAAGETIKKQLDWEGFFRIAGSDAGSPNMKERVFAKTTVGKNDKKKVILAVARDEAFSFLYEDNLRLLTEQGVEFRFFSPLHDDRLPEGISGLLLSGGYPELYADQLSENRSMREDIRKKILQGLPTVAECGGFLYLMEEMADAEGRLRPMTGALSGRAYPAGRSIRFGYVEIEELVPSFLPEGLRLKGHEFHYFEATEKGTSCRITKPVTGRSWTGIITNATLWAGFPHIYYPAEPRFAEVFAEKMRKEKRREETDGEHVLYS